MVGWCFLDARRHLGGPVDFDPEEAREWGSVVQRASRLVCELSGCDRVYAIAFGEEARHLHLHLIPRHGEDPKTTAWAVADLYRAVEAGHSPQADRDMVHDWIGRARSRAARWISRQP
ncbi:HIT family protein [Synechococcus sp. HK01-R]|uniref:HIT family protein n=1 Tax=Synechococcus sp. HK01-R TaxID=2751171 RepID=UPI00351B2948